MLTPTCVARGSVVTTIACAPRTGAFEADNAEGTRKARAKKGNIQRLGAELLIGPPPGSAEILTGISYVG
jgi:hypothetical protein